MWFEIGRELVQEGRNDPLTRLKGIKESVINFTLRICLEDFEGIL